VRVAYHHILSCAQVAKSSAGPIKIDATAYGSIDVCSDCSTTFLQYRTPAFRH
jgi:hypothetical protein